MTVIVEPDSLSAWLGLAGVAVGALLTAGVTWLQARSSSRKDKYRDVSHAINELLGSANSLPVIVGGFVTSRGDPGAIREWIPAIAGLVERAEKADAVIARLAQDQPALVEAADKLVGKARTFVQEFGGSGTKAELETEVNNFKDVSRRLKSSLDQEAGALRIFACDQSVAFQFFIASTASF